MQILAAMALGWHQIISTISQLLLIWEVSDVIWCHHLSPQQLLLISLGWYSDFIIMVIVRNSITVFRYYWNSTILVQKGADPSRSETPWLKTSQILYEDLWNWWWYWQILTPPYFGIKKIDYCDFHYHSITIISIYYSILSNSIYSSCHRFAYG